MKACPEREAALALLKKYNSEPFHIQHALTVEGTMRWYANELGHGEDADFWATVGLMHDVDFEQWPEEHCKKAPELLAEIGCSEELIGAAARMRPSKSCQDMEVSSLKKKFKDKKFAAGCSRDVIKDGADRLGWSLEELLEKTILAMRSCEVAINAAMEQL